MTREVVGLSLAAMRMARLRVPRDRSVGFYHCVSRVVDRRFIFEMAEKEHFVRSFVEKMLAYALGRSVGATDRETVSDIIKKLESESVDNSEQYRLQSLVQAIVASEAFKTK